ncbi:MAG: exopolysaccharide biosynthesis protein [Elusimicrobia bacterium]|nr:exopolysaccharide biosynthesis protein [Elusimicrobiota bacterium]
MSGPGAAPPTRLSAELERLGAVCRERSLTVGELLPGLAPRDQALLTAVLAAGFMHPVPLPGLSSVFGLIIALAGARMARGLGPWVPARWHGRHLPGRRLGGVFTAAAAGMRRVEHFIKPRGRWLSAHPLTERFSGGVIAFCGLLLAMPAPPGLNFAPAIPIVLLSLGILEEDLLLLAAGYLGATLNVLLFGGLALFGWSGVRALLG